MTLINIANLLEDKEQPHFKKSPLQTLCHHIALYCMVFNGNVYYCIVLHGMVWYCVRCEREILN